MTSAAPLLGRRAAVGLSVRSKNNHSINNSLPRTLTALSKRVCLGESDILSAEAAPRKDDPKNGTPRTLCYVRLWLLSVPQFELRSTPSVSH